MPSLRQARVLIAGFAATASLIVATSPSRADQDDRLEQRRGEVKRAIGGTEQSLDQSSAELSRATNRLKQVSGRLQASQRTLRTTQGRLVAAQAADATLKTRLESAQRSLQRSRQRLRVGQVELSKARTEVRRQVQADLETGDPALRALSGLLAGDPPSRFTDQMSLRAAAGDASLAAMDRLEAGEVILALTSARVERGRDGVARQRRAAAENLALRKRLKADAAAQASTVSAQVTLAAGAQRAAAARRRDDLARLQQLETERDRLSRRLKAVAARDAAREAARARARARARDERDQSASPQTPSPRRPRDRARPGAGAGAAAPDNGRFAYPVSSVITSPYGMRLHPVLNVWKLHDGTDFRAPCGTPIKAAAAGRVMERYYDSAYGNRVILTHGRLDGTSVATTYNHMQRSTVGVGDRVRRGQVIGRAGTTGLSTGCHLHLMALEDGETVDPMRWLRR